MELDMGLDGPIEEAIEVGLSNRQSKFPAEQGRQSFASSVSSFRNEPLKQAEALLEMADLVVGNKIRLVGEDRCE